MAVSAPLRFVRLLATDPFHHVSLPLTCLLALSVAVHTRDTEFAEIVAPIGCSALVSRSGISP